MPENRSKQLLPIILIAGALIVLVTVRIVISNIGSQEDQALPSQTAVESPSVERVSISDAVVIKPVLSSVDGKIATIELWLNPGKASSNLSVMDINGVIRIKSGTLTTISSTPTINETLIKSRWKFPFAVLNGIDNTIELKMSAVYLSPEAYNLSEPTLLASIPVSTDGDPNNLTFTILADRSKLFDKQNNLLSFSNTGEETLLQ